MALGTAAALGLGLAGAGLAGGLVSQAGGRRDARKAQEQGEFFRNLGRERQTELIKAQKPSQVTPEMEARLKALEEESMPVPLVQDPKFQADRARLLQGGARELSSIQNIQRAGDIQQGGFRNVGSLQDVQDRLGVAMAGLAQQSQLERERKRDIVAETRQSIADAKQEFFNARNRALAAIEAGDMATALANLQAASLANQAINQQQQALFGNLMGIGGTVAGQGMAAQQNAALIQALRDDGAGTPNIQYQIPSAQSFQMPTFGSSLR